MSVPGLAVNVGAWCNGNTWVSKTFVVSSNLTAPAKFERFAQAERSFCAIQPITAQSHSCFRTLENRLPAYAVEFFPLLV